MKKILFITLSNIGDAVLTLPVLGALKHNFKDARIDVVVGPRAKEIFEGDPRLGDVYIYDKKAQFADKLNLFRTLKKGKYDLVVDLRDSLFGVLLNPKFLGRPSLGLSKEVAHKIDEHLLHLKILGIDSGSNSYPIWIDQEDERRALNLLSKKGITERDEIICIAPGAKSHIKRWTEDGFERLCELLAKEFFPSGRRFKIVFVGDSDDSQICGRIAEKAKDYAVSIAGQTNLRELAWCIKRARLLITNDSAPLHIAGSVATPAVAIFGPTDYRKYGPREGAGFSVYKKLRCSPCEKPQCRYDLECMKAISAQDVFNAAKEMLNAEKG